MSRISPYRNLYHRLVYNTLEPESSNGCWVWAKRLGKGAYPRIDIYIPGLLRNVTCQAHIALWVWVEAQPEGVDDFWLAYREFIESGLELDHLCSYPPCIFMDHMEPVTPSVNCRRRDERNGRGGKGH